MIIGQRRADRRLRSAQPQVERGGGEVGDGGADEAAEKITTVQEAINYVEKELAARK